MTALLEKMSECLLFLALTIIMLCKVFVFLFFHLGKAYFSFIVLTARQCGFACPNVLDYYTQEPYREVTLH